MKKILTLAAVCLSAASARADTVLINGAGATFPFPIYSKWFSVYNKAHPEVQINYQSIGSGGGIKQITERTVDFGASDAPMSDAELAKAQGLSHLPTVMGAVVVIYNVPGVTTLKLTPETLADIYLGKITKWNDKAIAKDNAGLKLPDLAIAVAHRSDGSGTTYTFTDYLTSAVPAWKAGPGKGKSVSWPVGLGGKGNEGVTGLVKQNDGGIGYVELAYATQNKLPAAQLKNASGNWVKPTLEAVSEAAAEAQIPDDFRVSIVNQPGKAAWPISTFTYLLVWKDSPDSVKGDALLKFIWWAEHDGQKLAASLDYAPLPRPVVAKVEASLQKMTAAGKAVLAASR
jgi:phosphate transport system substrate-binding protein